MDNRIIADRLRQHARALDHARGNLLRVRAYRRAADSILEQDESVESLFEQGGGRALRKLPQVGPHIAKAIECLISTGMIPQQPETLADAGLERKLPTRRSRRRSTRRA